jgi:ribosomal protein S18 acetylase RimI-like enzyme
LAVDQIKEGVMKPPGFQLRRASHADLDTFFDLFAQVQSIHADAEPEFFRPPEKDETFQQYFEGILGNPDQHLVFARLDGVEVGFVHFFLGLRPRSVFQLERRVGYIYDLVVDQAHRRTGCAAMLIEHVKQAARQEKIALLGIDFWSFNDAARACFKKAGFKVSREFMWLRV